MTHVFEVKDGGEVYWYAADSHDRAAELHREYILRTHGPDAELDQVESPTVMPGNRTLTIDGEAWTCEQWAKIKHNAADPMVGTTAV